MSRRMGLAWSRPPEVSFYTVIDVIKRIGQGTMLTKTRADGYVRIWSTEAIYSATDPNASSKPKQLASMSNHSGTIHTVRFSPNGKYLASGADDRIVCVYVHDSNPPSHASTFGMYCSCSMSRRPG